MRAICTRQEAWVRVRTLQYEIHHKRFYAQTALHIESLLEEL